MASDNCSTSCFEN